MRSDFSVNRVVTQRLPVYSVFVRYPCMAIKLLYSIPLHFSGYPIGYGSIVLLSTLISTILVIMYYSRYVGL